MTSSRRFDIALSFPGEHRDFIEKTADLLAQAFGKERVLYDHFHDDEFARPNLNVYLPGLYRKDSEVIAIFLCPEYAQKLWCKLEWRHIANLLATAEENRILFFSFGNPGDLSDLGILSGDGYIDILGRKLNPPDVVVRILNRLRKEFAIVPPAPQKTDSVCETESVLLSAIDLSRIDRHAPEHLLGREAELARITEAWHDPHTHVLSYVALGGEGKTSLVARWAQDCVNRAECGCAAAFAWSFYSQGASDQSNASADLFLREALVFFGDAELAESPRPAAEKGKGLAVLVAQRRALLVLDGVEPLQYPPASPLKGQFRDPGLAALLKALALRNAGLCLLTTRLSLADLKSYRHSTAPEEELKGLARPAGVALLAKLGVHGSERERGQLVEDVQGHALTLTLLGAYLRDAHAGDIRRRDRVKLAEADREEQNGHAFRAMDAYMAWLDGDPASRPALALWRLLGLFDRPADAGCLAALWRPPVIAGLTDALFTVEKRWFGLKRDYRPIGEADINVLLTRLADAHLLNVQRDGAGRLLAVDAHPLVREYFAQQLRETQPEAFRAAHERLFRHLCKATQDQAEPSLEDLQPLYQAVAHGCSAGLQQEALHEVYFDRIAKGNEAYAVKKLGAFGTELGAIACFFDEPWQRLAPTLSEAAQAWLLNEAAFDLRGVGRLAEALQPMRAGLEMAVKQENWGEAARRASNLSELELTLGALAEAEANAGQSVNYADRSDDAFLKMGFRTTLADALHQAGQRYAAGERFREAEALQAENQPGYPLLYSLWGFRYCDWLLAAAEGAAWRNFVISAGMPNKPAGSGFAPRRVRGRTAPHESSAKDGSLPPATALDRSAVGMAGFTSLCLDSGVPCRNDGEDALTACRVVSERAAQTLQWVTEYNKDILSAALDHLTLARARLYAACLNPPAALPPELHAATAAAVEGLRRSGRQDILPSGLLTRALLRGLAFRLGAGGAALSGPDSAQEDLDEAYEIAERGPMPLFLADIHLHRARLFGTLDPAIGPYPWHSAAEDLRAARRLIEQHGYGRRLGELEDAEAALLAP